MNEVKKRIAALVQWWKHLLHRKNKNKGMHLEKVKKNGVVYIEVQPKKMSRGGKVCFLCYVCVIVLIFVVLVGTAFAADDPLTVINNLSEFIFSVIRAVGLILLGWGIVQVGLSLQSHDPSQRSNGFLTLAGGVIITFAKEILTLITGG